MRLKVKILVLVSKHETGEKKSRSHLETWDCKIKFSFSSRSTRLRDRNSRSRLEAWDWKEEILDLVSKHETERKTFSISSRKLKKASRYALIYVTFRNSGLLTIYQLRNRASQSKLRRTKQTWKLLWTWVLTGKRNCAGVALGDNTFFILASFIQCPTCSRVTGCSDFDPPMFAVHSEPYDDRPGLLHIYQQQPGAIICGICFI